LKVTSKTHNKGDHVLTKAIMYDAGVPISQRTGLPHIPAKITWHGGNHTSSAVSVQAALNNPTWLGGVGKRGFGCKSGHVHERLLLNGGTETPLIMGPDIITELGPIVLRDLPIGKRLKVTSKTLSQVR
jgi:hypothetical protein